MNGWLLVRRGLAHYWRSHLGTTLGAALAAMILTGALFVGDSARETLRHLALLRVGKASAAMVGGDRFFRAELAEELAADLQKTVAPVILLSGSAVLPEERRRSRAQVLGVDESFWKLAPQALSVKALEKRKGIGVNRQLAEKLEVLVGDTLVLRVQKPTALSREAPLSGSEKATVAIRVQIGCIVEDEEFGRFSLASSQLGPATVFCPLELLQDKLGMAGKANLLLSESAKSDEALRKRWQLADVGLQIERLDNLDVWELRTERVFLEREVEEALTKADVPWQGVLGYFVTELRAGERSTPYSLAAAVEPGRVDFLPSNMAENEVAINQWLADDLKLQEDDWLVMRYFVLGERGKLIEESKRFQVRTILPMKRAAVDSSWMPDFPGLSGAEHCREWEPGVPIDLGRIRDKDEAYWKRWQGAPKAFVTLAAGQRMWGSRFGQLTAIRVSQDEIASQERLADLLRREMDAGAFGLKFEPIREQALAATRSPIDFGQLLLGFSFFLIAAAAALVALVFVFSVQQRNEEAGLLLAVGLSPGKIRKLFLAEGAVLATAGSVLGATAAVFYSQGLLWAMHSFWPETTGQIAFSLHIEPRSFAIGVIASGGVSFSAMWLASRQQMRTHIGGLLAGEQEFEANFSESSAKSSATGFWAGAALAVGGLLALGAGKLESPGAFFSAGALFLLAGLAFCHTWLVRTGAGDGSELSSLRQLARYSSGRRPWRSLAVAGILAAGVFIVAAVGAFRKSHSSMEADKRASGAGGFALIGESSTPILSDLNGLAERNRLGLSEKLPEEASIASMRVLGRRRSELPESEQSCSTAFCLERAPPT